MTVLCRAPGRAPHWGSINRSVLPRVGDLDDLLQRMGFHHAKRIRKDVEDMNIGAPMKRPLDTTMSGLVATTFDSWVAATVGAREMRAI